MLLKYVDENYYEKLDLANGYNVVKRVIRYILNPEKNLGIYAGCVGVLKYDIETMN